MQKSMDFEIQNQGKSKENCIRSATRFPHGFFMNFDSSLEGFGAPNGGQDAPKIGNLGIKKRLKI